MRSTVPRRRASAARWHAKGHRARAAQDERFRERFLRESRIAASLDHPHVIPIYQAGDEDGLLFLAMRYVEGSDLAKVVARMEHSSRNARSTSSCRSRRPSTRLTRRASSTVT